MALRGLESVGVGAERAPPGHLTDGGVDVSVPDLLQDVISGTYVCCSAVFELAIGWARVGCQCGGR